MELTILGASMGLQLIAAGLALRLARVTGFMAAWLLIASALVLMSLRQAITFYNTAVGDIVQPVTIAAEMTALTISALMLLGIVLVQPFLSNRKSAEAAVRREGDRAKNYLDIAGSIIYAIGADQSLTLLNRAGCRLMECEEHEAVGHDWFDTFVPAEERVQRRARFLRWMQGEEEIPSEVESRVISLKGTERLVRWKVAPLTDDDDNLIGVLSSGHDLTEQLRAERLLHQAQKMEAVGQLTSGIAHDFNNVLAVIMGNLDLTMEWVKGDRNSASCLAAAMEAAQKGADLNKRLLTFSKRQVLEERILDVNEVIRNMTGLLSRTLGEDIDVETVFCDDDCFSNLDSALLESAILNLAINARDATAEGGKLVIETGVTDDERLPKVSGATGPMVHILIRDNGSGMVQQIQERALDPFFTTKEKGSGLGLSMVFGFVQRSGGWLEIDSKPGEGTDVHVFLPRCDSGDTDRPTIALPETEKPATGAVVLVVEDRADVMTMVCRYLDILGYRALTAVDGKNAMQKIDAANGEIDLVLSDVILPGGINGIEVAKMAAQASPSIKTILMSGNLGIFPKDGEEKFAEIPLLRKPFRKAELAQALHDSLMSS